MHLRTLIALMLASVFLVQGCSSLRFPGVYRIAIQQGNYVEEDMVEQLEVGMSREQVQFILGTPTIEDSFNANRWDYPYRVRRGDKTLQENHFAVFFEGDRLVRWEGDSVAIKKQVEKEQEEALDKTEKKRDASF